ncbi:hypothetical protein HWV62_8160 [Athelia sp. TMB]|nr:hypothetical protein HWV62_8160 [Athelia sp. TMB]
MDAIHREDTYYYFGEPQNGSMSPLTPLPSGFPSPGPTIPPSSPASRRSSVSSTCSGYPSSCCSSSPTPSSSHSVSPSTSSTPSRKKRSLPIDFDGDTADDVAPPHAARKRKRKCYASDKEAAKTWHCIRRAALPPDARQPTEKILKKHADVPLAIETLLNMLDDLPLTSTGYIGRRTKSIRQGAPWTMQELIDDGFEVFDWDGM